MMNLKPVISILIAALVFFSCRKEKFITSPDATLYASVDSLSFDTVFATVGSITKSFKIFNTNNQKLRLSQVKLAGGATSPFKINVNGSAAPQVDNIEINANDSIYIFVQVNVNPGAAVLPFILTDTIQIDYNGNQKLIKLQAYGQNAIFLKEARLTGNVSWNNQLPYVILGGIQVDTNATLTVSAGTRIYLHASAPFIVDGTLIAKGSKEHPIIFSGDRMDEDYKDLPASWPGIYLRTASKNNSLKHTIIKNAYQGIIAQGLSVTSNPKLTLSQCVIDNIYDAGVLGIHTNIYADNCLISNCGANVQLNLGGDYLFTHCTVASYNNFFIQHKKPVLQIDNFMEAGTNVTAPLNAVFRNCIFWGDDGFIDNEIFTGRKGSDPFSITFDHVLYKAKDDIANATFISALKNMQPHFDSIDVSHHIYDFHFSKEPQAPAINAGVSTPFFYDLDDKLRDPLPDIGCYER